MLSPIHLKWDQKNKRKCAKKVIQVYERWHHNNSNYLPCQHCQFYSHTDAFVCHLTNSAHPCSLCTGNKANADTRIMQSHISMLISPEWGGGGNIYFFHLLKLRCLSAVLSRGLWVGLYNAAVTVKGLWKIISQKPLLALCRSLLVLSIMSKKCSEWG